jgi:hypothetical protein
MELAYDDPARMTPTTTKAGIHLICHRRDNADQSEKST